MMEKRSFMEKLGIPICIGDLGIIVKMQGPSHLVTGEGTFLKVVNRLEHI